MTTFNSSSFDMPLPKVDSDERNSTIKDYSWFIKFHMHSNLPSTSWDVIKQLGNGAVKAIILMLWEELQMGFSLTYWDQGPASLTVFPSQFKFDENSFNSHLDSYTVITTKLCTWHDSSAVARCAKICCDLMTSNGITTRRIFHKIFDHWDNC